MTADDRREAVPTHDAADRVPYIEDLLRFHYPKQTERDIYDRAVAFCAEKAGIERETLFKYLSRPNNDRRRV